MFAAVLGHGEGGILASRHDFPKFLQLPLHYTLN